MGRKFKYYAFVMFVAVVYRAFAQTSSGEGPAGVKITISVYDYAQVPPNTLATAERDAQRIFHQAGIEITWVGCLPSSANIDSRHCSLIDATHLVFKILSHALTAKVRDRIDVLGDALVDDKGVGYYAYAFYDRVQQVAEERGLGPALLGDVLAHEVGHLLLGSRAHSVNGIMSPHWNGDELRRISQGTMFFAPTQCRFLKTRLGTRQVDSVAVEPQPDGRLRR